MSAPTRAQIEADVARPTYAVEAFTAGVGWSAINNDWIQDLSGALEQTGGGEDGIGFGIIARPTQTIQFAREAFGTSWKRRIIRVRYGFDTSDLPIAFVGMVMQRKRGADEGTWELRGWDALIEGKEIRSPLFRQRPVFTRTTISSIENPATAGYAGGLGNYILWQCGGRPWQQQVSYPNAPFYYHVEHSSPIAPDWTWSNGDDALRELEQLCKAAGGLLFQDSEGVIRYVEPLALASGSSTFLYTDTALTAAQRVAQNAGHYDDIDETETADLAVTKVLCQFVSWLPQGVQEVYGNKTPRLLEPGAPNAITLPLDLQLPLISLDRVEIKAHVQRRARACTSSEVTVAVGTVTAQQVTITLTNTLSEPVVIEEIKIFGSPLVAGEEGSASYGPDSAEPRELRLDENVNIGSRVHAERLCRMYHDFYSFSRPVVTLIGCGYDPDRTLGEIVGLTCSPWSYTNVLHRIIGLRPRNGEVMDVAVVPIAGLPRREDFFIVGGTYADGTVLQLAY